MNEEDAAAQLSEIARYLLLHGNAVDALALLDSAVTLTPDDTAIVVLQCEAAHKAGRNEQAHERLAVLIPTLPAEHGRVLRELDARVLLALGRDEEAADAYRRARAAPASVFDPDPTD